MPRHENPTHSSSLVTDRSTCSLAQTGLNSLMLCVTCGHGPWLYVFHVSVCQAEWFWPTSSCRIWVLRIRARFSVSWNNGKYWRIWSNSIIYLQGNWHSFSLPTWNVSFTCHSWAWPENMRNCETSLSSLLELVWWQWAREDETPKSKGLTCSLASSPPSLVTGDCELN